MKFLVTSLSLLSCAFAMSACRPIAYPPRTDCWPQSDTPQWGCETHTYGADGSVEHVSRDVITDVARAEEEVLGFQARHYAERFGLSEQQGLKIAQVLRDYDLVQNRSDADRADFARRLYGIEPSRIVAAASAAQAGNAAPMNVLIAEAAKGFETTPANMKRIVQALHGRILEQQGIRF